jgi:hypothetical protein
MARTLILGIDAALVSGLACLLLGIGSAWLAFSELKDARDGEGEFSKRYQASFGHRKLNRFLVRFNSWTKLLMIIASAPFLIGLGIWLLLQWVGE